MKIRLISACIMLMVLISWIYSEFVPDTLWSLNEQAPPSVRYEPSSPEIVDEMLDIAEVCRADVVYDLGCGDGRIVIAAAKKRGARGIGIDNDPVRVRESRENAKRAGVSGVKFRLDDLYECSLRDATVVMLYLLPEANIMLRPKLFRELSPGARIVSHSHSMGRWRPDRQTAEAGHRIYFWIIPANVSGRWSWHYGGKDWTLLLHQEFQDLRGTVRSGNTELVPDAIKISGDRLALTVSVPAGKGFDTLRFSGIVAGNTVEGTAGGGAGSGRRGCVWKAERDPVTIRQIY
jgi:SAM-dependent methyltransferase